MCRPMFVRFSTYAFSLVTNFPDTSYTSNAMKRCAMKAAAAAEDAARMKKAMKKAC